MNKLILLLVIFLISCHQRELITVGEGSNVAEKESQFNSHDYDSMNIVKFIDKFSDSNYSRAKYRNDVATISAEANDLKDARNSLYSSVDNKNEIVIKLKKLLAKIQVEDYPVLRKNYIKVSAQRLWEEDVKVLGSGKKTDEITYIGGVFATHANIKSSMESLEEILKNIRFKRVTFKWIEDDNDYTFYTLKVTGDSSIEPEWD